MNGILPGYTPPPGSGSGDYIPTAQKGAANGVAPLDAEGKVPSANLPPSGGGGFGDINEISGTAGTFATGAQNIITSATAGTYAMPTLTDGQTLGVAAYVKGHEITGGGRIFVGADGQTSGTLTIYWDGLFVNHMFGAFDTDKIRGL